MIRQMCGFTPTERMKSAKLRESLDTALEPVSLATYAVVTCEIKFF